MTEDDDKPDDPAGAAPDSGPEPDDADANRASADGVGPTAEGESSGLELDEDEANRVRSLIRGAMKPPASEPPAILDGFQRKIRQRSRGKFYGDGWSTSKEPPISTYLVTSLVMLAIVFIVYAVLGPLSGAAVDVGPPAPVRIVPPELLRPAPAPPATVPPPARSASPASSAGPRGSASAGD